VRHEVSAAGNNVLSKVQDIVYREAPRLTAAPPAQSPDVVDEAQWTRRITPDPLLLFRYSA
jgi:3-methylfumaryl-CoA hydratase